MGKTRDKLTAKQLHFCRCVAAGMSQAEAYREAFDVTADGKTATHREAASRLMARADIRARVDALVAQRERSILASSLSDRERVLSKLRHWVDHAEAGDSNRIRSAELLGKSVGLFREVVETSDSKSSDELLAELEAMIEASADELSEAEQSDDLGDSAEPTIMH
tara:strand:- start:18 stop:512 length:495 start_codon:yes stop_codon:yes gene_type:complete